MRKSVLVPASPVSEPRPALDSWLDLEHLASLEISSEDPAHPFEHALAGTESEGWKSCDPGPQTIRFKFDEPRSIRRVRVEFREPHAERSQEFTLSAVSNGEKREIVRQQFSFSPSGATAEIEDYTVNLANVSSLELVIDPGRHDRQAHASLQSIAIA
ncbi:MAG TPA: hypothetical protein VHZ25_02510 [Acidobacteriaceae bacterium]|nr:hypothetical protein [Acidobacteriaceae bacterium]